MKKLLLTLILGSSFGIAHSQNTVGLLSYDFEQTYEGYNLCYPFNQGNVYLLDMCGRVVNMWEDTLYHPGVAVYLDEDGLLYACKGNGSDSNEWIHAGGGGEMLEIRDLDDNILWQWAYNDSMHRLHHDIALMPNGNILAIAWERKLYDECVAAGRDTTFLPDGELWPDMILEIEPVYPSSANIVWEWHAWDHMVQNYDINLPNYGAPENFPTKIDINYFADPGPDWHHLNSIAYNPILDQISVSSPKLNEIWIIDHSIPYFGGEVMGEVAQGKSNDGLIYRWGNQAAYNMGDSTDQKLFFQHDIHWIDNFVDASDPDYGKLIVFNNRYSSAHSSVDIFAPEWDETFLYYPMTNGVWGPSDYDWHYQRPDSANMYSNIISGAQRLPNGNTLICVGRHGYAFEITPDEEVVWEYKIPLNAGEPVTQGTVLGINNNMVFRFGRYPVDMAGFVDANLAPIGYMELEPNTGFCPSNPDFVDDVSASDLSVYPNPVKSDLYIGGSNYMGQRASINVYSSTGALVYSESKTLQALNRVNMESLSAGFYILQVVSDGQVLGRQAFVKE